MEKAYSIMAKSLIVNPWIMESRSVIQFSSSIIQPLLPHFHLAFKYRVKKKERLIFCFH